MRSLRLVALSDDGEHLVLIADEPDSTEDGERFELPLDDHLRELLRAEVAKPAPAPADDLPPRVIQARIRGGETPEQVAESSGTRVERIMRFAHPVLQERERVAERAREARVRLSEGTPTVPLEQFMAERLRLLGADLDAVSWDAHRSEDGTWQVRAAWRAGHTSGSTRWSYDIPARTITPLDAATMDFAEGTRLVRVVPDVPHGLPPAPVAHRPIAVVPSTELTDADELDTADRFDDDGDGDDVRNVVPADGTPADAAHGADDAPAAAGLPDGADARTAYDDEVDPDTQETVVLGTLVDGETEDPRARIPAWEDIVFGVRRRR